LTWEANQDLLKDFFAGLSLEQIASKNGKDTYTVNRILTAVISKNWERDRRIFTDFYHSFLTLDDLGQKHGVHSRNRVYQIIEEIAKDMEKLGINLEDNKLRKGGQS